MAVADVWSPLGISREARTAAFKHRCLSTLSVPILAQTSGGMSAVSSYHSSPSSSDVSSSKGVTRKDEQEKGKRTYDYRNMNNSPHQPLQDNVTRIFEHLRCIPRKFYKSSDTCSQHFPFRLLQSFHKFLYAGQCLPLSVNSNNLLQKLVPLPAWWHLEPLTWLRTWPTLDS